MLHVQFAENPISSTFKTDGEPDHFPPASQLPSWSQATSPPPPTLLKLPPNYSLIPPLLALGLLTSPSEWSCLVGQSSTQMPMVLITVKAKTQPIRPCTIWAQLLLGPPLAVHSLCSSHAAGLGPLFLLTCLHVCETCNYSSNQETTLNKANLKV